MGDVGADSLASLFVAGLLIVAAVAVAASLRPWRVVATGPGGPPWPWLALPCAMPLLWALDRHTTMQLVPTFSGASMLVLMAGWPLAVLLLLPVATGAALAGPLEAAEAMHRLFWLGLVPATGALGLGAALRRFLPRHIFIYILGRGFFATFVVVLVASLGSELGRATPSGVTAADLFIAHLLSAFGEASITGMFTAIMVAYRPHWLATYADRLYLPPAPRR